MAFLSNSLVDRDFTGGVYLPRFGPAVPLEPIETVDYNGDLYLPLRVGPAAAMRTTVEMGRRVKAGELLAHNSSDNYLHAPRSGIVGPETTAWVAGRANQPVLTLQPLPKQQTDQPIETPEHRQQSSTIMPNEVEKGTLLHKIEQAGMTVPDSGEALARLLQRMGDSRIRTVIANATPLEPSLNGPLAILHNYSAQVFAGLAILRHWLGAATAIMAYPHLFAVDYETADQWQVKCVPVSEKYPQARPESVIRTLIKQGYLSRRQKPFETTVVFDIQLLRQVERLLLGGELPTEKIITISGDGVAQPAHFLTPLGTPLAVLLRRAGLYDDTQCIVCGSTLSGTLVDPSQTVVDQITSNYSAIRTAPPHQQQTCIRCGWCIDDCPARIDPARFFELAQAGRYQRARQIGIFQCIECGICSYICPSRLPIMQQILKMKKELRLAQPEEQ